MAEQDDRLLTTDVIKEKFSWEVISPSYINRTIALLEAQDAKTALTIIRRLEELLAEAPVGYRLSAVENYIESIKKENL